MNLKRKPLSKSGRLLWAVRHNLIMDYRIHIMNDIPIDPQLRQAIEKLNDRIQLRLWREDRKKNPQASQASMFREFEMTFIKPGRKRVTSEVVVASTESVARKILIEKYGDKTKFITNF